MMRTVFSFLLILLVLNLFGQNIYLVANGSVAFTSEAPLELIEAENKQLEGALNISDRSFVFRSPMSTFEGFNSALQKTHFNANYLKTSKFPYTIFEGKIIEEIDFTKPGTYTVRGKGRFTCHGIVQERIIKCKLIISKNTVQIKSSFTVMLDDHNIKIPSVVNQKIAEEIVIELDIVLKSKQ